MSWSVSITRDHAASQNYVDSPQRPRCPWPGRRERAPLPSSCRTRAGHRRCCRTISVLFVWASTGVAATYLVRLLGVGLVLTSDDSATGSVAATSGSLTASSLASSASVVAATGVSVVSAGVSVEASGTVSSFFSSDFFSLLPPSRAPKIEVRFLLEDRLPSSTLVSLAASSLASSLGASVVAAGVVASVAATGVSSAAFGVSSAFLSSTALGASTSFLAGVKEAMVDLYFSDSVMVVASSLASVIFSLSWATQLSRSAAVGALKVCL